METRHSEKSKKELCRAIKKLKRKDRDADRKIEKRIKKHSESVKEAD